MPAKMERTKYPGIFKRGERYVVTWRDRGKLKKESFRTLAQAKEAQGKRRQPGGRETCTRARFDDYARKWIASYAGRTSRGFSDSTREQYTRALERHAIPYFGRRKLVDVRPSDVKAFIQHLQKQGLRTSSIRKVLSPVKAMYATAIEDGDAERNPATHVRIAGRSDEHVKRVKALTREELRALVAALPAQWRPFFTLLAHTGLRISEALALTWADLDLGVNPRVRVRRQLDGKGSTKRVKSKHSERDVPLSPQLAATLRARRASNYDGDDALVFASTVGTPLSTHNVRKRVLLPAAKPLGLDWVGFHTFRHTCASLLFANGKDAKQVQEWLGHADPGFTLRTYVHLLDEGVGGAEFMDEALAPQAEARTSS